jgi:penicillin-binding protein 1A
VDKNPATASPDPSQQRPKTRAMVFFYRLLWVTGMLAVLSMAAAGMYLYQLYQQAPTYEEFSRLRDVQPSMVLSAQGKHLTTFRHKYQEKVVLEDISPWVIKALVATEDHRFFDHQGIDYRRTVSAVFHTLAGDPQGGSTITQQLVRNLFPEEIGRARTAERKLREMVAAYKLERATSKQDILETYLNTVPFLYHVVGIEMAAQTYFGKSAAGLDIPEAATLVGMLKGTSYYNPVLNPERARQRRNVVMAQMVKHGMLDQTNFLALRSEPLGVRFSRPTEPPTIAPHFVVHLRQWIADWARRKGHNLYTDGLIIHTTLDDSLQQMATEVVAKQTEVLQNIADVEWGRPSVHPSYASPAMYANLRKKVEPFSHFWKNNPELEEAFIRESVPYRKAVADGKSDEAALEALRSDAEFMQKLRRNKTRLEAGFVVVDPVTAEVKAWVGSRDFDRDQYDHVARAARQPGSTFKPFVYAAALEQGMAPSRTYRDVTVEIVAPDGDLWRPTNMDGQTGRHISLREGLIQSKNTITAQVMFDVGYANVVRLAQESGISQSPLKPVPSLALGTSPVTLLEMVSAYTTIAQSGEHRDPILVRRITDRYGEVIESFGSVPSRAISEPTAHSLIDMMRGVVQRGTGTALISRFGIKADVAGKSGTTQNNTDGWFILMHPNLVAGAWVGFNDQRIAMRSDYWGQGGRNAILLVGDFFRTALKEEKIDAEARFPKPAPKKGKLVHARATVTDRARPSPLNSERGTAVADSGSGTRNERFSGSPVTSGSSDDRINPINGLDHLD